MHIVEVYGLLRLSLWIVKSSTNLLSTRFCFLMFVIWLCRARTTRANWYASSAALAQPDMRLRDLGKVLTGDIL